MKNQWIRWADRNDLECAYLVVTSERFDYRVINDEGDTESYQVSNDFIYILGKVPNEYFDKIIDRAWEKLASSFITGIEIKTESQICHDDKMKAMRDYEQRNAENHYLTVLETVQYYQNKDYQIFTYHNKFLGEIAARTSTASQPNQEAQPNQERTDAAEQTNTPNQAQPRAVRSKRSSPKQTQAGAGSSEQPKRKYFKFPKDKKERIEFLCSILRDLRDGKDQNEISGAYGFSETLWTKPGKKKGLGQCLPKLKERALLYARDNKERLKQRANKGDCLDFDDPIENADWLFCAALLDELHETELDPKKDINRREVPMGQYTDRGTWE